MAQQPQKQVLFYNDLLAHGRTLEFEAYAHNKLRPQLTPHQVKARTFVQLLDALVDQGHVMRGSAPPLPPPTPRRDQIETVPTTPTPTPAKRIERKQQGSEPSTLTSTTEMGRDILQRWKKERIDVRLEWLTSQKEAYLAKVTTKEMIMKELQDDDVYNQDQYDQEIVYLSFDKIDQDIEALIQYVSREIQLTRAEIEYRRSKEAIWATNKIFPEEVNKHWIEKRHELSSYATLLQKILEELKPFGPIQSRKKKAVKEGQVSQDHV